MIIESKREWDNWKDYNQNILQREAERTQLQRELANLQLHAKNKTIPLSTLNFMFGLLEMRIILFQVLYCYHPNEN